MRIFAVTALLVAASSPLACVPGAGARGGAGNASLDAYRIPQSTKDDIRAKDKVKTAAKEADEDEKLDAREKEALQAFGRSLGKASAHRGPAPESSSTVVVALRKTPVKVRIEPITDDDGKALSDDFVQLKDSCTDRVTALQRKLTEQTASKSEIKEIQDGARYMMKVNDLRMEVSDISTLTYTSNLHVQMDGLQTMLKISMLLGHRKMMEMELDDDDYATVARSLERQRRSEAIAASTMGMLAAYIAVVNEGKDPKALDALATSTLEAFPLEPTVTPDEAKAYVANMSGNIAAQKSTYERMMRKTYGDAKYEKKHKADVDALFAQAESLQNQKSSRQIMQDKMAERGARAAGVSAPAATAPATDSPDQAAPPSGVTTDATATKITQGMGIADAARKGDATGALDGAAKMFPANGAIGSSLSGISALSKGDARGAIDAAMNLVPGGGLVKDGLSLAANLLFGGGGKKS